MNIKIMSKNIAEQYKYDQKHIFISISEPHHNNVNLPKSISRIDVLRLKFYDIDKNFLKNKQLALSVRNKLPDIDEFLFSKQQAQQIINFVEYYYERNNIDTILINCLAGVSRSAAVGASLSKIYNNNDDLFFEKYCPNLYVYKLILEEYKKKSRF